MKKGKLISIKKLVFMLALFITDKREKELKCESTDN